MKVRMCETVDVEAEVEISPEAILNEFSLRFEDAMADSSLPVKSAFLPLVDFATKLLARIPAKAIGKCKDSQREEIVKRLRAEADRWNEIMVAVD